MLEDYLTRKGIDCSSGVDSDNGKQFTKIYVNDTLSLVVGDCGDVTIYDKIRATQIKIGNFKDKVELWRLIMLLRKWEV